MPAGALLTRASVAWTLGADGRLASVPMDAARFDHQPGGSLRGLMVEAAATNRLLQSQALGTAPWISSQAAVAAGSGTGPHGSACDLVVELSGAGPHGVLQTVAVSSGQTVTLSAFSRASGRSRGVLRLRGAGTVAHAAFDLAVGTVTGLGGRASIVPLPGGWFRIAAWGVADAPSLEAGLLISDASGSESYPATGAGGIFLWGAMVETGAGATSYVASGTAQGARAADRLELDWGGQGTADGAATVRHRFDDGSTQDVGVVVSGGRAVVPVPLDRAWLRRTEMV